MYFSIVIYNFSGVLQFGFNLEKSHKTLINKLLFLYNKLTIHFVTICN